MTATRESQLAVTVQQVIRRFVGVFGELCRDRVAVLSSIHRTHRGRTGDLTPVC